MFVRSLGRSRQDALPVSNGKTMKTLIVEDDSASRLTLRHLLKSYGPVQLAVNGKEAVDAVRLALEAREPFNLICLDIMMPDARFLTMWWA